MTHKELCLLGARFAKSQGFDHIIIEPGFRKEQPDVFAFSKDGSIVIECKVSRSDFLADQKKPFRKDPSDGVGKWRFYLVTEGVATQEDMPEKWQLLIATDKDTIELPFPRYIGMMLKCAYGDHLKFSTRNTDAEISLMWSWVYRKEHKVLPNIPDTPIIFKNTAEEKAQTYLQEYGQWKFWEKYYGEKFLINQIKIALNEKPPIPVPRELHERYKEQL